MFYWYVFFYKSCAIGVQESMGITFVSLSSLSISKTVIFQLSTSDVLLKNTKSPSNKCFTGAIDKIVDLESKNNSDIDKLVARKERAIILFSHLDGDKRLLMSMRYLESKSWEDIAETMFFSLRKVYYLHGMALNELRKLKELED